MYQPLPPITEDLETLEDRLRRERHPKRKPRLPLLVLLKSGEVPSRSQAATHLALHRNTVAAWLRRYRTGGLEALLTYKEAERRLARRRFRRPCSRNSKHAWRPRAGLPVM
jgi:transposase